MLATCVFGLASSVLGSYPTTAKAASWPEEKPVHIIVPFAPGGSNDIIARKLADALRERLGQAVVVENKPGAGTVVGASYVAKSPPNGYTLMFVSGSLATAAAVQNPPYDTKTAFEPITIVAESPFVLITREGFPAKNVPELIEYAKAHPGKVNYGTAGLGDHAQLMTEWLAKLTGTKMQNIAYKGISPAQLDLYAGRLDFIFTTIASLKGTPADTLPKIAFTSLNRDPDFPDIPTVKEQTGLDYEVSVWWGLFGPAGLDPKIRDRLNAEVKEVVNTPDLKKFLATLGARPTSTTPEQMKKMLTEEVDRWTDVASSIGIRPQ